MDPVADPRRSGARPLVSSAVAFATQKPMPISRYIVAAVVRCLASRCVASPPVQLAESEVAVGDEGAHAELVGPGERLR